MPKYQIELSANLNNVTELQPIDMDYEWTFTLQCTKCREITNQISFAASAIIPLHNSRGNTNFQMKCPFCKSEGSLDIEWKSVNPYLLESSGTYHPFVIVEGRGWEPSKFHPMEGMQCKGLGGAVFDQIDLSEDWCDYDEQKAQAVDIMEVSTRITKVKK